jgi:hypothetical protein
MTSLSVEQSQGIARSQGSQEKVNCPSQLLLIRSIQQSRNEEPCFATDKNYCCGKNCEWRTDCRTMMTGWSS